MISFRMEVTSCIFKPYVMAHEISADSKNCTIFFQRVDYTLVFYYYWYVYYLN